MNTIKFSTPFGFIELLKNDLPFEFDIVNGSDYFDGYPLNDGTKLYPLGLYTIIIPIHNTDVGDTFIVRYSKGELKDDGGGESTRNAICELDGYVFGFGWADSEDIETGYKFWNSELYTGRTRILPYSENGIGGEAGIGSVLRMQGQPRESHREGHGQDLTESSFQHTRP